MKWIGISAALADGSDNSPGFVCICTWFSCVFVARIMRVDMKYRLRIPFANKA